MLNYKNLPLLLFPVAGVNFSKKKFWHTLILFLYLVLMRYTLCVWLHLRYNPSPITRVRHYLYCMCTLKVRKVHTNIDCLSHLCNVEIKEFSWNPNSIWKQYVFTDNCICRITLFLWAERGKGRVVSFFITVSLSINFLKYGVRVFRWETLLLRLLCRLGKMAERVWQNFYPTDMERLFVLCNYFLAIP